jgi:hypothetical protein
MDQSSAHYLPVVSKSEALINSKQICAFSGLGRSHPARGVLGLAGTGRPSGPIKTGGGGDACFVRRRALMCSEVSLVSFVALNQPMIAGRGRGQR